MTDTETPSPDHYPVPRDDEEGLTIQRDWTAEEEKKAKWKSSSTDTDNFMKDIGITQDQFNVCQQVLSLGIVLFEIPSNMILYRADPGRKSTIWLFSFGLATREIHVLRSRVLLDDPAKGEKKKRIVVNGFGFGGLSANALAAVGLFWQIPVSYTFSYVSDHLSRRGETVIAGLSMHLLGYISNRIFTEIHNRGARYAGVVWTQPFGTFSHPLNITLMSLTCTDSEERALAMAMVIMGANIADIYGAQIFRADDRPRCRRAFNVNIAEKEGQGYTAGVKK
ncbi:hypothetical protein E4T50_02147 [Aureobasidium sp. EXF-12298]|nr:hypothetical protein E4T50_02147 [Aureobasidium sp. EXF-12298]KAI4766571.1 hypothetical protein E4T51_00523 [Aureobasidium sp. EXF-12344]KAI4776619.1 hypothetical protein E4T52_08440 [Aureobasidium sp. EXF-3400]